MASNALTTSTSPKFAPFRDVGVSGRGAPKSWALADPFNLHLTPPSGGLPHPLMGGREPAFLPPLKEEKDLDQECGGWGWGVRDPMFWPCKFRIAFRF